MERTGAPLPTAGSGVPGVISELLASTNHTGDLDTDSILQSKDCSDRFFTCVQKENPNPAALWYSG